MSKLQTLALPITLNAFRLLAAEAHNPSIDRHAAQVLTVGFGVGAAHVIERVLADARSAATYATGTKRRAHRHATAAAFVILPISAVALRLLRTEAKANGITAEAQAVRVLEDGYGVKAAHVIECVLADARSAAAEATQGVQRAA